MPIAYTTLSVYNETVSFLNVLFLGYPEDGGSEFWSDVWK
jgi:hypothetical protein